MQREIEFRAWTTHNGWSDGCMVTEVLEDEETGYLNLNTRSVFYQSETHKEEGGFLVEKYEWIEDKSIFIMQYTGLKDKNGVKIFEGDILSFITQTKKGFFEDGKKVILKPVEFGNFCYGNNVLGDFIGFHIDGCSIKYNLSHGCEVIGNIHQNPELVQ